MSRTKSSASTKKESSAKKKKESVKPPKEDARTKAKYAEPPEEPPQPIRREVTAVLFFLMSLFTVISYFNTDGAFIRQFSELGKGLIGYGFWLLAPVFFLIGIIYINHHGRPLGMRVFAAFLIPVIVAAIVHLSVYIYPAGEIELKEITSAFFIEGQRMKSGGALGGLLSYGLESAFGVFGAFPVLLIVLFFLLLICFNSSVSAVAKKVRERPRYDPERYESRAQTVDMKAENDRHYREVPERQPRRRSDPFKVEDEYNFDIPLGEDIETLRLIEAEEKHARPARRREAPRKAPVPAVENPTDGVKPMTAKEAAAFAGISEPAVTIPKEEPKPVKEAPVKKSRAMAAEISDPPKPADKTKIKRISRDEVDEAVDEIAAAINGSDSTEDYKFPPVELLRSSNNAGIDARDEIRVNRERLESALHSFGISARIVGVIHGPTVTRYDVELEQGVKLARITNLSGDIALSLGVVNVRIAPIPDKISTVGIEVPNKLISTVYLRDIIDSPKFVSAKSKISFAIGKDISGDGVVGNIAKLPHLLIAGTTGSGKSVCMNSLILSLLYKARPDEVRLIMIDPKMVELGIYNGIPHLYVPVVTDPKKAAGALQWSVVEMLKRYRLFADVGVRNLEGYNAHCQQTGEQTLPQVVIVIDELADLMLVAAKEVEESICRVAQMGRAAGMHLVIATQRPSADVITGLMKANIPSRIAFAVSSAMESRIILDQGGAEKLIGMGDMLFSPVGSGKPTRIQGAFVSDEEREDVIMFIKENSATAVTNDELVAFIDDAANKDSKDSKDSGSSGDDLSSEYDEMLPQAVEVVIEMKSCSVSMLQRRVKLGYSRAARIVDQMEELGVVGPFEGAKSRQVLVDREGWKAIQIKLGMIPDDGMSLAAELSEGSDFDDEY